MAIRSTTTTPNSPARDRIAMVLMILASVAAFYAMITAIGAATAAGPDTRQVEWWRVFGFLMFTCLFAMLAFWPRRYPGLWELLIIDKAALTIAEVLLIQGNAANALSTAVADGVLTIILVAAYLLSRGYSSWRRTA